LLCQARKHLSSSQLNPFCSDTDTGGMKNQGMLLECCLVRLTTYRSYADVVIVLYSVVFFYQDQYYTVSNKRPTFDLLESKKSHGALFSHLACPMWAQATLLFHFPLIVLTSTPSFTFHFFPFLLALSIFQFLHAFPFYQNRLTLFPSRRS